MKEQQKQCCKNLEGENILPSGRIQKASRNKSHLHEVLKHGYGFDTQRCNKWTRKFKSQDAQRPSGVSVLFGCGIAEQKQEIKLES